VSCPLSNRVDIHWDWSRETGYRWRRRHRFFFFFFLSTFYNATVHNTCIAYLRQSLQVIGERGEGLYEGQSTVTLRDHGCGTQPQRTGVGDAGYGRPVRPSYARGLAPNCGGSTEGGGHGLPSTGPGIPLRAAQEHKGQLSPSTSQAAQFGSPSPVEGSARSLRLSRLETTSKGAPYSLKSRRSTAPSLY
jgi:hypothetical protein